MNKKSKKAQRKKLIEQNPPLYLSEGHWEEFMLENNSYYDIDMLEKHNAPIKEEIRYWEEEFQPSGNMGKWWQQIQISKLKKKLKHYK